MITCVCEFVFAEYVFVCVCICRICVFVEYVFAGCVNGYMRVCLLSMFWYFRVCVCICTVCVRACACRVCICVFVSSEYYHKSLSLFSRASAEFLSVSFTDVLPESKTLLCTQ